MSGRRSPLPSGPGTLACGSSTLRPVPSARPDQGTLECDQRQAPIPVMAGLCGAKVRVDRVEGDSSPVAPGYVHVDLDGNRLDAVERRAVHMGDYGGRIVSHQAGAAKVGRAGRVDLHLRFGYKAADARQAS